jgi:hypothetical protein
LTRNTFHFGKRHDRHLTCHFWCVCVKEQNGRIWALKTLAPPGGHQLDCLLADSTQQLNLNSSRLSLTGTKWINWGWIPDYSNSFPYETTHKLLTWLFPIIFRNFFNIKIYNSNKKYGGFKTTNTTYNFLKKRIIFLPVAVRKQQCVVCVWVKVPTNFGEGNISINIHIHAKR